MPMINGAPPWPSKTAKKAFPLPSSSLSNAVCASSMSVCEAKYVKGGSEPSRTASRGGHIGGKDSLTLQPCISDTDQANRSSWPDSECFSVTRVVRQGHQRRRWRLGLHWSLPGSESV